ncbi:MAG: helix-turn-helix transcriptional regulator [Candidatus Taylorbacteria bacterium]|nr:helix-turn-helix transcriptional regulator [Candidatus Taylorbacteria bacterium]
MNTLLSDRETEVLRGVANGYISKEIADNLGISVKTVEKHRERILWKLREVLGVEHANVADMTHFAISHGYVELKYRPPTFSDCPQPTHQFAHAAGE